MPTIVVTTFTGFSYNNIASSSNCKLTALITIFKFEYNNHHIIIKICPYILSSYGSMFVYRSLLFLLVCLR